MPGPGKYDIPDLLGGDARKFVFPKGSREEKYHKKNSPEPCTYDQFQTAHLPRTLGGRWSRGDKVTFIDLAAKKVNRGPGPEKYNPKEVLGHIQSREFQIRKSETRIDENNSIMCMCGLQLGALNKGRQNRHVILPPAHHRIALAKCLDRENMTYYTKAPRIAY